MNKKNLIVSAFAILLSIIGLIWLGAPANKQSNITNAVSANKSLVADNLEYDFGTISMANGNANHTYKIKNNGAGPANISKISTSCMCTTANVKTLDNKIYGPFGMPMGHSGHSGAITDTNITVPAGGEIELTATFDPNAHGPNAVGPVNRIIYIQSDASKEPLKLTFTANVVK